MVSARPVALVSSPAAAVTRRSISGSWVASTAFSSTITATDNRSTAPGALFVFSTTLLTALFTCFSFSWYPEPAAPAAPWVELVRGRPSGPRMPAAPEPVPSPL